MVSSVWQLENVSLGPEARWRLSDVTLSIPAGVTVLLGDSGAGKTSLLNLLAGFETPDRGDLTFHPPRTQGLPLAWVPADGGLWPGLTVRGQIEAVLPDVSAVPSAAAGRVDGVLASFGLDHLQQQFPETLSLGERARLSVARALASEAAAFVMDEPLAHVDSRRLIDWWNVVSNVIEQSGSTLIFSTHLPEVALRVATHAICLDAGKLVWQGPIDTLYRHPPDERTAAFLGPSNFFTSLEFTRYFPQEFAEAASCTTASHCLRPEELMVEPDEHGTFVVAASRFAGSIAEVELRDLSTQEQRTIRFRPPREQLQIGQRTALKLLGCLFGILLCMSGCHDAGDSARALPLSPSRTFFVPEEGAMLPAPRGVTFGPNEELYILDNAGRVIVYDKDGTLLRRWWMPEYKVGKPEGAWHLRDGRIAVADTHYHRVVFFDQQGNVVGTLGEYGQGPGQFIYTVSVVQDPNGNLYVAEYGGNDRVQKFSSDGTYLLSFGAPGTEPGEFQRLSSLCWKEGTLYVADAINSRVQAFKEDGTFVGVIADATTCDLRYPYDISLAPDGTLFVAEYGAGRITQLTTEGQLLGHYGTEGRGPGQFWTPWGIAVSPTGKVVVADTGNRRVVELQL